MFKRFIATGFLCVYIFTIGGQLAMREYAAYLSHRFFAEQSSKGLYNINDLTEIKLKVDMPYITDWAGFEQVSGQIQFKNTSYNYVAMRITRTAIYLRCVPNYDGTKLSAQNILNVKGLDTAPVKPKNHVPPLKELLIQQVAHQANCYEFSTPLTRTSLKAAEPVQSLIYSCLSAPEQPPKTAV